MTWDHGDCLLINPVDHTLNLVIDKGDMECVMCSSDQIKRRMNMYRDDVGGVLRLGDIEVERLQRQQRRGGGG